MRRIKEWLVQAFKGFTLMELLIVVIIIGILAALAIPQYTKTIERAHWAEAIDNLGQIRSAEIRYYAEYDKYTPGAAGITDCAKNKVCDFSCLDITDPNNIPNNRYDYALEAQDKDAQTFTLRATRNSGKYKGAYIQLKEDGTWNKAHMYNTGLAESYKVLKYPDATQCVH